MKHLVKVLRPETVHLPDQLAAVLDPVLCDPGMGEQHFPLIHIFDTDDVEEVEIVFELASDLFGPI